MNFPFAKHILALLALLTLTYARLGAADVPQWRGDRSGIYPESGLMKQWPDGGPKMLWHNDNVGLGYSAPSVVGGTLYLTGLSEDGERELLNALDKDGNILWTLEYGRAWTKSFKNARLMPTILDGKAYLISGHGEVVCIDLEKKSIKWKVDAKKKFQGVPRDWGYAENPLVADGKVIFTCGGMKASMVALDAETGETVWKSESLKQVAAYVTPMAYMHNGKMQIVGGLFGWLFGVDAKTGEMLWKKELLKMGTGGFAHEKVWETNVAMPIYRDGRLFASAGNNCGCYMLELPEWKGEPKVLWSNGDFDTHHGGDILLDGKIYGPTWINNDKGNWACYEWESGKKVYDAEWPRHSKGSIVYADGLFYCYEEKRGAVALVRPGDSFEVVSTFNIRMGRGQHWCHPVISDGIMYIRRGNVLMAFDIRAEGS